MKHIKQRKNECFLNTLAMLSDKPVDEILAKANALSPYTQSWDDFTTFVSDDVGLAFQGLCRIYAPYLIDHVKPIETKNVLAPGFFNLSSEDYVDLVGEGRGAILLAKPQSFLPDGSVEGGGAHICAFENGMIYDSALDEPMDAFSHFVKWASRGFIPFKVIEEK